MLNIKSSIIQYNLSFMRLRLEPSGDLRILGLNRPSLVTHIECMSTIKHCVKHPGIPTPVTWNYKHIVQRIEILLLFDTEMSNVFYTFYI